MALRKLLSKPPPRIFSPRRIRDIRINSGLDGPVIDPSSFSAIDLADFLFKIADRGLVPGPLQSDLPALRDDNLNSAIERTVELMDKMDPVLVSRIICTVSRMDIVEKAKLERLITVTLPRINELSLGCLSRLIFAVSTSKQASPELRIRVLETAINRAEDLINPFEKIPGRVLAKLYVSFSELTPRESRKRFWDKLEHLSSRVLDELDISQVQQISYSLSRIGGYENNSLSNNLLSRAILLSPPTNPKTFVSLFISLARIGKSSEDWRLFEKIFRDHFGIGDGYISRERLRRSLASRGLELTETSFQRVLDSLKK